MFHRTTKATAKPAEFFDEHGNCSLVSWQIIRVASHVVVMPEGGCAGTSQLFVATKARIRPT
jgi:hypothetical protein